MEPCSTNSALDELIGTQVRVWPYLREAGYPRDILGRLWTVIEQAGDGPRAFWGLPGPNAQKMDLPAFCAFFSHPEKVVLFVTSLDGEDLWGMVWFEELCGHRAFGSTYMVPDARGAKALEAVQLACAYLHRTYDIEQIWALTPWKEAGQLIHRAGFTRMATLPEFAQVEGLRYDVGVYRKVRT